MAFCLPNDKKNVRTGDILTFFCLVSQIILQFLSGQQQRPGFPEACSSERSQ